MKYKYKGKQTILIKLHKNYMTLKKAIDYAEESIKFYDILKFNKQKKDI